jgi:Lysozyme like domain
MTVNRATRAGGGLTALLTLACMVMGATPGAFASKQPTPSASAPGSVGPGVRPAPRSMAVSNAQVCGAVAAKAGFSYHNYISTNAGSYPVIVVAVAVALAESGCQWNIYLCNPSLAYGYYPPVSCPHGTASYDRGLWQINSYYHNEVSDSCAFQVQCNTAAAFNISKKGHNWSAWPSYTSGAWANYISIAKQAVYGFSFQLENHGDGTCLDASSAQAHDRGTIFQWACNASDNYQRWKVVGTVGHLPFCRTSAPAPAWMPIVRKFTTEARYSSGIAAPPTPISSGGSTAVASSTPTATLTRVSGPSKLTGIGFPSGY